MNIEELGKFDVSKSIIDKLMDLGFESLTETQEKAVEAGLFDGESLLVDAPTNTGKTFIGELAALNASKQREHRRSFFLVPLRALAEQMFNDLVEKYEEWGLKIAISTSDHYEHDNSLMEYDIVVSTYEKLIGLLVKRPDITKDIGLVVVDEIQHIGDRLRGVSLEMLLTRLKFFSNELQIVGLSATTSNAKELANWLKCKLIHVESRDVELREGILYVGSGSVTFHGFSLNRGDFMYREFNSGEVGIEQGLNLNNIERISERSEKEQCLIFVNTQRKAEMLSQRISTTLRERTEAYNLIKEIDELVESSPSTRTLKETLKRGVAFHHAGLLADERRIIEDGFRQGLIRVICSTPTLGAGVNTPAKNVIILFSKYYNGSYLFVRTYKNISGRAGRLRKAEEYGRSIVLAENERELEYLWNNYIEARPETVRSQMAGKEGFGCSLLGLLSSKVCSTREELTFFLELTFFGYTASKELPDSYKEKLRTEVTQEVDKFVKMELITENEQLKITDLGRRCAEELFSPDTVVFLHEIINENEAKIGEAEDYENLVPGLIHLCCCTADADNLFPPRSRTEIQELEATWTVDKDAYFFKPLDSDSFLISLRTTRMMLRWMEGITYFELSSYAPAGVIKRIAGNLQWILRGLARLCEKPIFRFDDEFLDFLYRLSERAYFGVPKEALPIARLRIKVYTEEDL